MTDDQLGLITGVARHVPVLKREPIASLYLEIRFFISDLEAYER